MLFFLCLFQRFNRYHFVESTIRFEPEGSIRRRFRARVQGWGAKSIPLDSEFINIGTLSSIVRVILVKYRDAISEVEERAFRFEYDSYSEYSDYPETKVL